MRLGSARKLRHEGQESAGSRLFSEAAPALHVMRLRETASRPSGERAVRAAGHARFARVDDLLDVSRATTVQDRSAGATGSILTTALSLDSAAADLAQRLRLRNKRGPSPGQTGVGSCRRLNGQRGAPDSKDAVIDKGKAPDARCKIEVPARAARSSRPLFRLIRRRLTSPTVVYATNPTVLSERGWRTT